MATRRGVRVRDRKTARDDLQRAGVHVGGSQAHKVTLSKKIAQIIIPKPALAIYTCAWVKIRLFRILTPRVSLTIAPKSHRTRNVPSN